MSQRSTRSALDDGWALARPFWRARAERRAWVLLAAVVALTLGTVGINVRFSVWNNRFHDALQNHDLHGFWHQLGISSASAGTFLVTFVLVDAWAFTDPIVDLARGMARSLVAHGCSPRWWAARCSADGRPASSATRGSAQSRCSVACPGVR